MWKALSLCHPPTPHMLSPSLSAFGMQMNVYVGADACRQGRTRLHGLHPPPTSPSTSTFKVYSQRAKEKKKKITFNLCLGSRHHFRGVVLSPLKRCCHNAFVSPNHHHHHHPSPPAGEGAQGRHLMARMHSRGVAAEGGHSWALRWLVRVSGWLADSLPALL